MNYLSISNFIESLFHFSNSQETDEKEKVLIDSFLWSNNEIDEELSMYCLISYVVSKSHKDLMIKNMCQMKEFYNKKKGINNGMYK